MKKAAERGTMMQEKLAKIKEEAMRQIQAADVPEKLNEVREMCIRDR